MKLGIEYMNTAKHFNKVTPKVIGKLMPDMTGDEVPLVTKPASDCL